jgi:hypothetical protein
LGVELTQSIQIRWSVEDLATTFFSILYHQYRQAGATRPSAIHHAQVYLRSHTMDELCRQCKLKDINTILADLSQTVKDTLAIFNQQDQDLRTRKKSAAATEQAQLEQQSIIPNIGLPSAEKD